MFFGRQRGAKFLLVFASDASDFFESGFSFGGEVERIGAPVRDAGFAFDESKLFHLVQHENEPAGKHAKHFRELLLADARLEKNDAKDAGMRRGEFERGEAPGEFGRRVRADLRQKEGGSVRGRFV